MAKKSQWWAAVKQTTGEPEDNVIPLHGRPTLDDIERAVADAQNEVISQHAECTRAMLAYKVKLRALEDARNRMVERLKESGARVEFVTKFAELEDDAE